MNEGNIGEFWTGWGGVAGKDEGGAVDENGDEIGLRGEILPIVNLSRRRSRYPRWNL